MKIDSIVRELRCVEKKYQDKILSTYKLDIYAMAKASADTIECLQKALDEKTELLNATIAGQETLQKAFAESQRRELAAVEDLQKIDAYNGSLICHCNEILNIARRWRGARGGDADVE